MQEYICIFIGFICYFLIVERQLKPFLEFLHSGFTLQNIT